ncbi:hypothetical protein ACQKWADRAFT_323041 [Trichoderma austrokoningii]
MIFVACSFSPSASTQSGTTTNPRTLCPSEPAIGDLHQAANSDAGISTSSSSDLSHRHQDILPTWPNRVDRTKIRALACWHPDQNFHSFALFKLHKGLRLQGVPDFPSKWPCQCLCLHTSRTNNRLTYTGFGPEAKDVMRSLYRFAQQSFFVLYISLPSRRFPQKHRVETITPLADIQNLYQRRGGQLIEGHGLFGTRDPNTPPARPAKRKRYTAEGCITAQAGRSTDADKFAAHKCELEGMLSAHKRELKDMVNEKLTAHIRKVEALLDLKEAICHSRSKKR